jgi:hypothetical protein
MDDYKTRIQKDTKLSIGLITRAEIPGQIKIDHAEQFQLNLKSIVIRDGDNYPYVY